LLASIRYINQFRDIGYISIQFPVATTTETRLPLLDCKLALFRALAWKTHTTLVIEFLVQPRHEILTSSTAYTVESFKLFGCDGKVSLAIRGHPKSSPPPNRHQRVTADQRCSFSGISGSHPLSRTVKPQTTLGIHWESPHYRSQAVWHRRCPSPEPPIHVTGLS
jgi:hypothetical protein